MVRSSCASPSTVILPCTHLHLVPFFWRSCSTPPSHRRVTQRFRNRSGRCRFLLDQSVPACILPVSQALSPAPVLPICRLCRCRAHLSTANHDKRTDLPTYAVLFLPPFCRDGICTAHPLKQSTTRALPRAVVLASTSPRLLWRPPGPTDVSFAPQARAGKNGLAKSLGIRTSLRRQNCTDRCRSRPSPESSFCFLLPIAPPTSCTFFSSHLLPLR